MSNRDRDPDNMDRKHNSPRYEDQRYERNQNDESAEEFLRQEKEKPDSTQKTREENQQRLQSNYGNERKSSLEQKQGQPGIGIGSEIGYEMNVESNNKNKEVHMTSDPNDKKRKTEREEIIKKEREEKRNVDTDPDMADIDPDENDTEHRRNKSDHTDQRTGELRMNENPEKEREEKKPQQEPVRDPNRDPSRIEKNPDPSRREREDDTGRISDTHLIFSNRDERDQERENEDKDPRREQSYTTWEKDDTKRSDRPTGIIQREVIRGDRGFFNIDLYQRQSRRERTLDDKRMPDYSHFNNSEFSGYGYWERKFR